MLKYLVKPPQNKRKAEEKLHDQKSSLKPDTKRKASRGSKGDSLDIDVDAGDNATSLGGFEEQASTQTELDLALPPLPDDETIKQESTYEQDSRELSTKERIEQRRWVKGKSSLYVDAFNLALDSVLKKESFLFDDAELALFDHWRALSYGAQYL
ncbi:Fanconi-associated nuclease 1, partial [Ascosphaera atra]